MPAQRLGVVLRRGLAGSAACSKACSADVKVTFTVSGRKGRAASAVKAKASSVGGQWVVKLSKAAQKRLRKARSAKAVVTITARSGAEVATATRRVSLKT